MYKLFILFFVLLSVNLFAGFEWEERVKVLENFDYQWLNNEPIQIGNILIYIGLVEEGGTNSVVAYKCDINTNTQIGDSYILYKSDTFIATFRAEKSSDNGILLAFDEDYLVKYMKFNQNFESIWGNTPIIPSNVNYGYGPYNNVLISDDNGGLYSFWLSESPTFLMAFHLNGNGENIWNSDPILYLDNFVSDRFSIEQVSNNRFLVQINNNLACISTSGYLLNPLLANEHLSNSLMIDAVPFDQYYLLVMQNNYGKKIVKYGLDMQYKSSIMCYQDTYPGYIEGSFFEVEVNSPQDTLYSVYYSNSIDQNNIDIRKLTVNRSNNTDLSDTNESIFSYSCYVPNHLGYYHLNSVLYLKDESSQHYIIYNVLADSVSSKTIIRNLDSPNEVISEFSYANHYYQLRNIIKNNSSYKIMQINYEGELYQFNLDQNLHYNQSDLEHCVINFKSEYAVNYYVSKAFENKVLVSWVNSYGYLKMQIVNPDGTFLYNSRGLTLAKVYNTNVIQVTNSLIDVQIREDGSKLFLVNNNDTLYLFAFDSSNNPIESLNSSIVSENQLYSMYQLPLLIDQGDMESWIIFKKEISEDDNEIHVRTIINNQLGPDVNVLEGNPSTHKEILSYSNNNLLYLDNYNTLKLIKLSSLLEYQVITVSNLNASFSKVLDTSYGTLVLWVEVMGARFTLKARMYDESLNSLYSTDPILLEAYSYYLIFNTIIDNDILYVIGSSSDYTGSPYIKSFQLQSDGIIPRWNNNQLTLFSSIENELPNVMALQKIENGFLLASRYTKQDYQDITCINFNEDSYISSADSLLANQVHTVYVSLPKLVELNNQISILTWCQFNEDFEASIQSRYNIYAQKIDTNQMLSTNAIVSSQSTLLLNCYPNPFNPSTTISYTFYKDSNIELNIYNIKGQLVKNVLCKYQKAGTHEIIWNGKNNQEQLVSSGIFFYQLKTDSESIAKKMMVIK